VISAIVLAAGMSSRMGEPKALLPLGGEPMLARVLSTVRRSRAGETVVVLGFGADRVREGVGLDATTTVINPDFARGMSSSIRVALRAARPDAAGFLIVLGDQPFVSSATLDALIERHEASGAKILVPTVRGVRGNPVLVDRSLSGEMARIAGDVGCRAIFGHHRSEIVEVPVDDPGILVDIDTPEEYRRAAEALQQGETSESALAALPGRHPGDGAAGPASPPLRRSKRARNTRT